MPDIAHTSLRLPSTTDSLLSEFILHYQPELAWQLPTIYSSFIAESEGVLTSMRNIPAIVQTASKPPMAITSYAQPFGNTDQTFSAATGFTAARDKL